MKIRAGLSVIQKILVGENRRSTMEVLRPEEFWRYMLRHEPTREQRKRRYLYHGFLYYLILAWRYRDRIAEVLAVIAIGAFFVELYFLTEIIAWLSGVKP